MAQKIEKLSEEQLTKLSDFQNKINETLFDIGRVSVRERFLKEEAKKVQESLESLQNQYDDMNNKYGEYLAELDKIYPNGEVDLNEGTVYFESAE
jgi:chromosome segregation ATPase